jgi:hypothetical protein
LDEELLKQIKVIDKYSIHQNGQPAVKIIGEIPELARVIKKSAVIYEADLYKAFLINQHDYRPEEFLRFICQLSSSNYPFYFLFKRMKLTPNEGKNFLENVKIPTSIRKAYIKRIEKDERIKTSFNRFSTGGSYGTVRSGFLNKILNKIEFTLENEEQARRLLEAVFFLEKGQYDTSFVKEKLFELFEKYYPFDKEPTNYLFRDALAYLDYLELK